jgi:hypothetical protein
MLSFKNCWRLGLGPGPHKERIGLPQPSIFGLKKAALQQGRMTSGREESVGGKRRKGEGEDIVEGQEKGAF